MFFCAASITFSRFFRLFLQAVAHALFQRLQPLAQGAGQSFLRLHAGGELAADFALFGDQHIQPGIGRNRRNRPAPQEGEGQGRDQRDA
jgi:hypothetical protein